MIRAGIVGFGNIGPVHAAAVSALVASGADVELAAICDTDHERLERAGSAYPEAARYDDYSKMVAEARLDVVHICTPHRLHAPMAERALETGSHVLTEKPLAMDAAEGRRLASLWRGSGRLFGVCFQNRYRPPVIEAERIISSRLYGRILGIRAWLTWRRDEDYYAARHAWRGRWSDAGGGLLINQAIHSLDLIQWLGGGCRSAACVGGSLTLSGIMEVEDSAIVRLDLEGGVRGFLFATNGYAEDAPVEIEILCQEARLRITDALYVYPSAAEGEAASPFLRLAADADGTSDIRHAYWGNRHDELIRDFYGCVASGRPFPLNPDEGLKSLEILDSCYAALGRPPRE